MTDIMMGQTVFSFEDKIRHVNENPDSFYILTELNTGLLITKARLKGIIPRKGDRVKFYTDNEAHVLGLDLNDEPVYFLSEINL